MYPNYSKAFLDLEDVFVKKVIPADSFLKVFIETRPTEQSCPCCSSSTRRIHDYRTQEIDDIPFQGKAVTLVLRKRRYLCTDCGKRFYEHYSFLPLYHRRTRRLAFYVILLLRQTFSLKQVSLLTGVSVQTICRLLDTLNYAPPDRLPEAISIDEFKGNASTGKYQCILVDPKKHRILDILPDRTQSHLADYFRSIPRLERLKVKFFVSDMWLPYVELARVFFPHAKIIVDKYHFIRQVTWAIENVRKRLQRSMPATLRKYYKRSRKLILTRYKKLVDENKKACDLMLQYSDDLRLAHMMKEWFYDICQTESYRKQQQEFDDWIANARDCGITEFEKCAKTFRSWRKEILNAFKYGITNGVTEGFNNKIKVLKRSSYGIRNFKRFRTRILHCTS
ncbi:ISL3 family transposase [Lacrimispora algidixylanolytica]|uniref:Transposase n=1 Tax=Lacrimispora algidixylanolytica TaxID=94868 RepID=A0A419T7S1_9FIRM|nr:ISL3 family transposase [Lacrimispora algidixylanolytica]RKD33637.1 transposase [Lacrimispora algidixylanolytica]